MFWRFKLKEITSNALGISDWRIIDKSFPKGFIILIGSWKLALGSTKYSGLIGLETSRVRHLDIRLFPSESKIPSILHFTGSGLFNQQLRSHSLSLGYTLSEYHLKHVESGELVSLTKEEDIFTHLGIDYVAPKDRDL